MICETCCMVRLCHSSAGGQDAGCCLKASWEKVDRELGGTSHAGGYGRDTARRVASVEATAVTRTIREGLLA